MRKVRSNSGFTLIELMVAVAVAIILATLAAPGFGDFVANSRLTTMTNDFITALSYARSEAVRHAAVVNVTAVAPGNASNEWGGGWNVVRGGTVIRRFPAQSDSVIMDGTDGVTTISFDGRGMLRASAPIIVNICDDRTGETGRQVNISPTGRPNLERKYGGCS